MTKKSEKIANEIKRWIVTESLQPGHHLPQEKELIEHFKSAKSTVREAIKILEAQGLVTSRTGPGGGTFVSEISACKATSLLSNFFYFKNLKIQDIYQLRRQLEPEIVASLCGQLSDDDLNQLKGTMTIYSSPVASQAEEYQQRIDELAFHEVLAELCPNPLLSFFSQFLLELLKNLNTCHDIYNMPNQELFETGRYYQMALYDALKNSDADGARLLIREHMITAERIMTLREREIKGQLL